ncbi:MAG: flagellin N-terminal helical domain-containing protein, partial [Chloroflexota bacterium]
MALSISFNTAAYEAAQNLQLTSNDFITAIQRLSSGLRINSAADSPVGLALSQKLTGQINGYDQAQRNIQDGASLLQVAQSGLNETQSLLQRMNQLAIQAAQGTLTS